MTRPNRRLVAVFVSLGASACLADIPPLTEGTTSSGSGGAGGGGASSYCEINGVEAALVCENFDDSPGLPPGWVAKADDPGAYVEIAEGAGLLGSRSLRARVEAPGGGGGGEGGSAPCYYALLTHSLDEDPIDFDLELQVKSAAGGVVVGFEWKNPPKTCYVLVYNQASRLEVSVQALEVTNDTSGEAWAPDPFPYGALDEWRRITLGVERSGAPRIVLNGDSLMQADELAGWAEFCAGSGDPGSFNIRLGSHCVGTMDNVTDSYIDDVVLSKR